MKVLSPLPRKKARLEIIPLIDIMFFLLAAFMIVSLTMTHQHSLKVNLPTATQAQRDFKPDILGITVNKDGGLHLEQRAITLPELYQVLTNRLAANPNLPVYISGDSEARHGQMVLVLDFVRRAGAQKVAFTVQAAPPEKRP